MATVYLLLINIVGFMMMGLDKRKAIRHAYRIPEASLFFTAWLGGSIGCLLGMYTFRHKTRKPKFVYGIPFILFLELTAFMLLIPMMF